MRASVLTLRPSMRASKAPVASSTIGAAATVPAGGAPGEREFAPYAAHDELGLASRGILRLIQFAAVDGARQGVIYRHNEFDQRHRRAGGRELQSRLAADVRQAARVFSK